MRQGRGLGLARAAHLDRGYAFALRLGLGGQRLKGSNIADPFNMQAKRGNARITQQRGANLCKTNLRLISSRYHKSNRQAALLHADVDRHVRALGDNRNAAFNHLPAVLIGPERCAIQIIHKAIAIGAYDRHWPCGLKQRVLQGCAVICLGVRF